MTESEKITFIEKDLYHELRCLLGAVTVWCASQKEDAGFGVVIAMDSAFVHTRCLFNFFTRSKGGNDVSITAFGPQPYSSQVYTDWDNPLNQHVLHISKGRLSPKNLRSGSHLNEQVENFAREILKLWEQFENDPLAVAYKAEVQKARVRAIEDAKNDAEGRIAPLSV